MLAMQYEITLPADYDMAIIRHRVATKGPLLDDWAGLGLKAYCVRERGVDGSAVNQYSPFYLWHAVEGMNEFLFGAGFQGIIESFGRPVVQQWTGLHSQPGPARGTVPTAAVKWTTPISAEEPPAGTIEAATEETRALATEPGVHTSALAVDTRNWQLVRFTLFSGDAPVTPGHRYQVLHLSTPDLAAVTTRS